MTNSLPLVSIIIPAYNTAPYIHRALESSLRQTYQNIEAIVVNDGSTDDTLKVAQEYAARDERVRVFTQENAGVSAARNYGIREARGEYITMLDSDDWLEDDAVEALLDAQMNYPGKLPVGGIYNINVNGKDLVRTVRSKTPSKAMNIEDSIYSLFAFTLANAPAKLFKTEIIRTNNLKYSSYYHYGEDRIFLFSYLQKTNGIALVGKPVINVLLRDGSAIHIPYDKRKIFDADGTFHDHAQAMIDNADTPACKDIFKVHHAVQMMQELGMGVKSGISGGKFRALQGKAKTYAKYFLSSKRIALIRKVDFLCGAYLPVPLARLAMLAVRFVNDTIKAVKHSDKGEVIPYW